jgi:hypothetical protein
MRAATSSFSGHKLVLYTSQHLKMAGGGLLHGQRIWQIPTARSPLPFLGPNQTIDWLPFRSTGFLSDRLASFPINWLAFRSTGLLSDRLRRKGIHLSHDSLYVASIHNSSPFTIPAIVDSSFRFLQVSRIIPRSTLTRREIEREKEKEHLRVRTRSQYLSRGQLFIKIFRLLQPAMSMFSDSETFCIHSRRASRVVLVF